MASAHSEQDALGDDGDEAYRTCSQCGRDCEPEPVPSHAGMRIAFVCPVDGVHTVVDPFNGQR